LKFWRTVPSQPVKRTRLVLSLGPSVIVYIP
jgi:hypothetical protein